MWKLVILICTLFAITTCANIPPSPDFSITDFVGTWNIAGLYVTTDLGLNFYSCATLTATLGTLSRLTIDIQYINAEQGTIVDTSTTVVPSPLNKAILVSTTSPSQQNNLVVTYYNSSAGEAIIINPAGTFGVILSKNENPFNNNLKAYSSQVLTSLELSVSDVTYIFNRNCDIQKFQPLSTFDASSLNGEFYGNAIFTTEQLFQDVKCFSVGFQSVNNLLNVTSILTYNNGKVITSVNEYLPKPQTSAVLINADIRNLYPYVILYVDAPSNTFLALTGDGTKGFVFSQQQSLSQALQAQVTQALNRNGLVVDSDTFYTLNSTCPSSLESVEIYL